MAVEDQRRRLIREVARDHKLPFAALEKRLTAWKQALNYPEDLEEGRAEPAYLAAYRAYEAALAAAGLWDYEDLIARPTLLLDRDLRTPGSLSAPLPPSPGG